MFKDTKSIIIVALVIVAGYLAYDKWVKPKTAVV
jgi:hypothetical protein